MTLLRTFCHTKIVATLGPASDTYEGILELVQAGANVFRLNFSHGTHEDHQRRLTQIRKIEEATGEILGVFMDLQGPKLRVGSFEKGIICLKKGEQFTLDLDTTLGTERRVCLPHPEIFTALRKDAILLLDDGKIRLQVISHTSTTAITRVLVAGKLSDHKGVNVPHLILPIAAITPKDRLDLEFGLSIGVDWVALSFVQSVQDVLLAKELIQTRAPIIAKIEKPSAVTHLEDILDHVDAIMVARGDLGVEMDIEDVPIVQKKILRAARQAGKPAIVATQMLESMIHAPTPTRAEASDVATAIYDGADAVMLSAESASGEFPKEAVSIMHRIILRVQKDPLYFGQLQTGNYPPEPTDEDAITVAARQVADTLNAAAIITFTESGATARRAGRERPRAPILAITPNQKTLHQLALSWGVYPLLSEDVDEVSQIEEISRNLAIEKGFCRLGQRLVLTAGVPFRRPGTTNLLRIIYA